MNLKLIISVIILGVSSQSIFGGLRPVEVRPETVQQVVVKQQPKVQGDTQILKRIVALFRGFLFSRGPQVVVELQPKVKSDTQILEWILAFIQNNQNGDHVDRRYHACKLAKFIYAARHEPTTSELELIPLLKKQGNFDLLADINVRLNYCNDLNNDWRSNGYAGVLYQIKAIADYLYWMPEDTVQVARVFLSHLLALHAARKPMEKIDDYMKKQTDIAERSQEANSVANTGLDSIVSTESDVDSEYKVQGSSNDKKINSRFGDGNCDCAC